MPVPGTSVSSVKTSIPIPWIQTPYKTQPWNKSFPEHLLLLIAKNDKTRKLDQNTGSRFRLDQSTGCRDATNVTPRMLVNAALVTIAADDASALVRRMMKQRSLHVIRGVWSIRIMWRRSTLLLLCVTYEPEETESRMRNIVHCACGKSVYIGGHHI